ncbi:hypothetical protein MTO96_011226 [Rhipicephalus appendiculatus]
MSPEPLDDHAEHLPPWLRRDWELASTPFAPRRRTPVATTDRTTCDEARPARAFFAGRVCTPANTSADPCGSLAVTPVPGDVALCGGMPLSGWTPPCSDLAVCGVSKSGRLAAFAKSRRLAFVFVVLRDEDGGSAFIPVTVRECVGSSGEGTASVDDCGLTRPMSPGPDPSLFPSVFLRAPAATALASGLSARVFASALVPVPRSPNEVRAIPSAAGEPVPLVGERLVEGFSVRDYGFG